MSKLLYITFVLIGLTLMACPYESKVELNTYEQAIKTDKKLLDQWVSFHKEGGREELSISKLEKAVLQVYHKQFGKTNKLESRESYRVYATEINEYEILTIETKDENKYLFAKYGWTGKNEFYIQFVDANYMENNFKEDTVTTKKLRAFITEHVNKENLYTNKIEFYRKHSPEYEKVRMFMKKSGF